MKRSFFLPLVLLVYSLGSVACGERGNGRPMTQDGNRVSGAAQKTEAERIAKQTRGVARVDDRLDVSA
jgi:hypothetical protein